MGAYEKKLYTRRDSVGNVATQTEALYCTAHYHVNTEATSIESGSSYPGRSEDKLAEGEAQPEAATVVEIQPGIIRSQQRP